MFNLSLQRHLVEIWCESFRSLHVGIRNDFWTDSDKCVSRCVRSQHFWVVTSSGRSVVARQRANTVVVAKRESWVCRWRHARCSSYSLTSFRPLRRRPTATAHPVTQQIHLDTISSIYLLYWYTLMPNSHRRRDVTRKKTVCRVGYGGVNWTLVTENVIATIHWHWGSRNHSTTDRLKTGS